MGIFSKKSKIKPEYKKSLVARLGMKSKEMDQKFQEGIKICNAASEDSNPGGKFQEGCEIFMDLTKHGHLPSIEQLVYIFLGQKEFDVAEGYIDRAKDPNDPIILYLKARLMEEREGIDAAVESFKAAAEAGNPNSISLMFSWAIQDCDIKEAEDCLEKLKRHKEFFAHPGKSETIEDLQKQLDDLKSNQQSDDFDSDDEEIDEYYDENYEIWTRYKKYALGDKKSKAELKRSDSEYYELFEKLSKLDLLNIWIEWTRDFDFQREVTQRHEEMGNQFDYLHGDETGEEFESNERLSIDSKYLPENMKEDYMFNIESGYCSISARKPRTDSIDIDEDDENSSDYNYYLSSRIDCLEHKSSKECYKSSCLAAAITVGAGLGDGVYQTAAYTGQDGQIASVLAFFYWISESDFYYNDLFNSAAGVGFLRNHIPVILGHIKCEGELTFGDSAAWATSDGMNDLDQYEQVSFQVPSDDYLIIGWLNADNLDLELNRTFVLGAYRGSLKEYFLKLAEAYPVMKNFKKINAEQGLP